jgi:hypothetical protein
MVDARESDGLVVIATQGNGVYSTNVSPISEVINTNNTYAFDLEQNFPNPAKNETNIKFALSEADYIDLKIFNLRGNTALNVFSGFEQTGEHYFKVSTNELPDGIYLIYLRTSVGTLTKKMIVNK